MFTRTFWKDTAERALATAAQAAAAVLSADGLDLFELSWPDTFSVAGMAAVLSVLKALAAAKLHDPESASLVDLPGKHAADHPDRRR